MRRVFIHRSPDPDGGGGPTLADIQGDLGEPFGKVDPAPAPLPDPPKPDDEPKPGDPPKDPTDEELDEDGNPIVKDTDDPKPGDDPDPDPDDDDDDPDDVDEAKTYWDEVAKIADTAGVELEPGLDPETTAKNIQKIAEANVVKFEEYLKNTVPDAYRYFVHASNGGDRESFFNNSEPLPPSEDDVKANPVVQETLVRDSYSKLGLSSIEIDSIINTLKTDGRLETRSLEIRKKLDDEIQAEIANKNKEIANKAEKIEKAKTSFTKKVEKVVEKGQLGDFVVPEKDRVAFAAFFTGRIVPTDDGKYIVNYELSQDELELELQKEYLRFKKGNLQDIVIRKAKTLNARDLRLRLGGEGRKTGKGGGSDPGGTPPPLIDLMG